MGKHIGTGGLARGKILGRLAFYTWVPTQPAAFWAVSLVRCSLESTGKSLHLSLADFPSGGGGGKQAKTSFCWLLTSLLAYAETAYYAQL